MDQCVYKMQLWGHLVGRLQNVWEIPEGRQCELCTSVALGLVSLSVSNSLGIFQDFVSEIPMVGKINKGTVNCC